MARPKRCKVCELNPAERAVVNAALPGALQANDDDESLRLLAEHWAVTIASLRRHEEHRTPSPASLEANVPGLDDGAAAAPAPAPAGPGVSPPIASGDGWDGHVGEALPPVLEGPAPWLRPRAARLELEAQVRRLGDLVKDPLLAIPERIKLEPLLRQAASQLALVSGEAKPTDLDRVLASPEFARVMGAIGRVLLARCPEVYSAVVAAVRALDAESDQAAPDTLARAA